MVSNRVQPNEYAQALILMYNYLMIFLNLIRFWFICFLFFIFSFFLYTAKPSIQQDFYDEFIKFVENQKKITNEIGWKEKRQYKRYNEENKPKLRDEKNKHNMREIDTI